MKNCIKCNGVVTQKNIVKMDPVVVDGNITHFYVKCPKCGFNGPIYLRPEDAVFAWDYLHKVKGGKINLDDLKEVKDATAGHDK